MKPCDSTVQALKYISSVVKGQPISTCINLEHHLSVRNRSREPADMTCCSYAFYFGPPQEDNN